MFDFKNFFKKRHGKKADYDFLPLFFWDRGLSNTAKIIMCIAAGGKTNRERSLERLKEAFPPDTVESIREAFEQLERYGYLSTEQYKGDYGEIRVDHRLCNCPTTRLPKLVTPTGAPLVLTQSAVGMYDKARDLGFIAETGKDTTYLLYDALRIFTAVENTLELDEKVILPLIGTETSRVNIPATDMAAYPQAVIAVIVTTHKVIILQEDSFVQGRRDGLARFIPKGFKEFDVVSLDEVCSRITFKFKEPEQWGDRVIVDLITPFALDRFPQYYNQMMGFLPPNSEMPRLSYFHVSHYS